jgi:hypothetical protein
MSDIVRSIRAELELGNRSIDCYLFPDGEKRIGIGGASIAIGRSKEYLGRVAKTESKALKALTGIGYTGCIKETDIKREKGATRSKTISVRDFTKLITWDAVVNKNQDSIILLATFAETGLDDILDKVFKQQSVAFLLEKIVHYTKWTTEDLQDALEANYDDWRVIREQEQFLLEGAN